MLASPSYNKPANICRCLELQEKQSNLPYHYDPQNNSSETGERLEEPVGDGGLVVRGEVEFVGQAVQVFDWLSGHVVKVNLKSNIVKLLIHHTHFNMTTHGVGLKFAHYLYHKCAGEAEKYSKFQPKLN